MCGFSRESRYSSGSQQGVISGMEMVRVVPECLSLPRDFGAIMGLFVKESYWHLESGVLLNIAQHVVEQCRGHPSPKESAVWSEVSVCH